MGNSLGGAVAMTVAAEHPGRVAGLLLADSAGFGREANVSALPVVWGDADAVLPAHHAEAAAAAPPEARLHVFPDTGHMPQIERTEELVELAREFVASVEEQLRTS